MSRQNDEGLFILRKGLSKMTGINGDATCRISSLTLTTYPSNMHGRILSYTVTGWLSADFDVTNIAEGTTLVHSTDKGNFTTFEFFIDNKTAYSTPDLEYLAMEHFLTKIAGVADILPTFINERKRNVLGFMNAKMVVYLLDTGKVPTLVTDCRHECQYDSNNGVNALDLIASKIYVNVEGVKKDADTPFAIRDGWRIPGLKAVFGENQFLRFGTLF